MIQIEQEIKTQGKVQLDSNPERYEKPTQDATIRRLMELETESLQRKIDELEKSKKELENKLKVKTVESEVKYIPSTDPLTQDEFEALSKAIERKDLSLEQLEEKEYIDKVFDQPNLPFPELDLKSQIEEALSYILVENKKSRIRSEHANGVLNEVEKKLKTILENIKK